MKRQIFILLILLTVSASAQDRSKFLYAEFADKSVTLYPFYKPFGNNFDPAVTLGGGLEYKQKGNLTLFQTIQANGYSTQFIGRGATLTTSLGYRYSHTKGIFGEAMIGLGTTAFFPSRETFKQDENDVYVHATPLHVIAAVPINFSLGYSIGSISIYLKYRYMIIGPFAEIMPIVPSSLLGLGIRYSLKTNVESR